MAKKQTKRTTVKKVQELEDQPAPVYPEVELRPDIDTDALESDGLTIRQQSFVAALVGPAGGNATKAAELAGYASENRKALGVTACVLLGNARVQDAISRAFAEKRYSPEWAKAGLVDIASCSLANFIQLESDGTTSVDFAKAAEAGALGQIKEYREESIKIGDGPALTIKRTIKLHDRRAALETLLKLDGKLIDRVVSENKHTHTLDEAQLRKLSTDELRAALAISNRFSETNSN